MTPVTVVLRPEETAYWVNFDIPVPLFLAPLYSAIRLQDAEDRATGCIGTPRLPTIDCALRNHFGNSHPSLLKVSQQNVQRPR